MPKNNIRLNAGSVIRDSSLPHREAEILSAFVLNKSREYILTHPEAPLSLTQFKKFRALELRRLKNWPIAYLTGHKEFYSRDFLVSPAVLTPRPETEMMIDEIIQLSRAFYNKFEGFSARYQAPLIIDLGTGSGAIIITAVSEIKRHFPVIFKKTGFAAVDISASALQIAKKNAARHKLRSRIKFYRGNLLTPLKLTARGLAGRQVIIAANLPYLTRAQIKAAPSISREPKVAIDGGKDGLKYYEQLFRQVATLGTLSSAYLLCEIDPAQPAKLRRLLKKFLPDATIEFARDLAGHYRLAKISL